jgi:hypothetical protein
MFYILSFLLSWLSGILVILITAFLKYDQFSIIDITSFAVVTFGGFLILFFLIYLVFLRYMNKKITSKQFIYYPLGLSFAANLPAYFLIWKNTPEFYGPDEALLFTLAFMTIALVFGVLWAWKKKVQTTVFKAQQSGHDFGN